MKNEKRDLGDRLSDLAGNAQDRLEDFTLRSADRIEDALMGLADKVEDSAEKAADLAEKVGDKIGDTLLMHKLLVWDARKGLADKQFIKKAPIEFLQKWGNDRRGSAEGFIRQVEVIRSESDNNPSEETLRSIELSEAYAEGATRDADLCETEIKNRQ